MKIRLSGFLLCLILLLSAEKDFDRGGGRNSLAPQSQVPREHQGILGAIRKLLFQLGKDWDSRWAAVDRIEGHVKLAPTEEVALGISREVAPWLKHEKADARGAAVRLMEGIGKAVPTEKVRQEVKRQVSPLLEDQSGNVQWVAQEAIRMMNRVSSNERGPGPVQRSRRTPQESQLPKLFMAAPTTRLTDGELAEMNDLLARMSQLLAQQREAESLLIVEQML